MAIERSMLSIEQIKDELTQIYNYHIAVRICVKLGLHPVFSFKSQLLAIWDELNACNDITVSLRMCEPLFRIKKSRINEIIHKRNKIQRDIPNRRKFDDPQEAVMLEEIIERFNNGTPFTHSSFILYVYNEYHAVVGCSFVDSFLRRHDDIVDQRWCKPREYGRMEVKREDVDRYKAEVNQYVVGKPTCCILAIDESGCQDWPDVKPQMMLVPVNITAAQLNYKVKRNGHLHTVMPAITLCGDTLPPLVVTKRLTLDYEVHATGLREGEDVVIVHGPKGYVNGSIMSNWITDQAIPYVDCLRPEQLGMEDEAILLMDNLRAHRTEEVIEKLRNAKIRPIFIPPHSSHALQAEDLLTFSVLKGVLRKANCESLAGTQAEIIQRVVAATEEATTPSRNRAAFKRIGLVSQLVDGRLVAVLDEVEWNKRMSELFPADAAEN
ncbi:MAG: hypothetical protein EZS28_020054 [Streblomastix strix]|uniref:DDE-1 domain-containing protein n=1 Tax=Streblomastix strix TaxID=222440 RepID=A0A5J4VPZ9_9EUKA|nr:MAG: hypothetical protein EZS28_020054 [Streblomastix strix]